MQVAQSILIGLGVPRQLTEFQNPLDLPLGHPYGMVELLANILKDHYCLDLLRHGESGRRTSAVTTYRAIYDLIIELEITMGQYRTYWAYLYVRRGRRDDTVTVAERLRILRAGQGPTYLDVWEILNALTEFDQSGAWIWPHTEWPDELNDDEWGRRGSLTRAPFLPYHPPRVWRVWLLRWWVARQFDKSALLTSHDHPPLRGVCGGGWRGSLTRATSSRWSHGACRSARRSTGARAPSCARSLGRTCATQACRGRATPSAPRCLCVCVVVVCGGGVRWWRVVVACDGGVCGGVYGGGGVVSDSNTSGFVNCGHGGTGGTASGAVYIGGGVSVSVSGASNSTDGKVEGS